jgi:hypothetical protein
MAEAGHCALGRACTFAKRGSFTLFSNSFFLIFQKQIIAIYASMRYSASRFLRLNSAFAFLLFCL